MNLHRQRERSPRRVTGICIRCRPAILACVAESLSVLLLGGCGSLGADASLAAAQLRFVEVSPGAPEMDFYVNGSATAYGVGFASFTSYLPVTAGPVALHVTRADRGQTLAGLQSTLVGGRQYTAVVSRGLGSLQEHLYVDQETPAPSGQMAIRVLNEVEGAGPMSLALSPEGADAAASATTLLTLAPGTASHYINVPANGSYTATGTFSGAGHPAPVSSLTIKAESGAVRTAVFAGAAPTGGRARVSTFTLVDVDTP